MNTRSLDLEKSSNQYAYITDAAQTGLDITGDFTLEAWVKIEEISTNMVVVGKYSSATSQKSYMLFIDTNLDLTAYFSHDGVHHSNAKISNGVIDDYIGKWVHIAATADVSQGASGIQIYLNGQPQEMTTLSNFSTSVLNGTADFRIGSRFESANQDFFDGKIDEVRVWNDIRTANEIEQNFHKELVGNEANLQGYWKLNNNYLDETSNNNDLTAVNSPVFSYDIPFGNNAIFFGTNF